MSFLRIGDPNADALVDTLSELGFSRIGDNPSFVSDGQTILQVVTGNPALTLCCCGRNPVLSGISPEGLTVLCMNEKPVAPIQLTMQNELLGTMDCLLLTSNMPADSQSWWEERRFFLMNINTLDGREPMEFTDGSLFLSVTTGDLPGNLLVYDFNSYPEVCERLHAIPGVQVRDLGQGTGSRLLIRVTPVISFLVEDQGTQ